jgi:hypothetical protein
VWGAELKGFRCGLTDPRKDVFPEPGFRPMQAYLHQLFRNPEALCRLGDIMVRSISFVLWGQPRNPDHVIRDLVGLALLALAVAVRIVATTSGPNLSESAILAAVDFSQSSFYPPALRRA